MTAENAPHRISGFTPIAELKTEHLVRRLECQALVARLTTELIGLSSDEIDACILRGLEEIANFAGADRVTVGLYDQPEADSWQITYEWHRPNLQPEAEKLQRIPMTVWKRHNTVLEGSAIGYASIEQVRQQSGDSADLLESLGMRSAFSLPILDKNSQVLGFIMFSRQTEGQFWDEETATVMQAISGLLIHSIQRREDDTALATSQERMEALLTSGAVGIFAADQNDTIVFANETFEKLAGFTIGPPANIALRWQDLLEPAKSLPRARLENSLAQHGSLAPFEANLMCPDGRILAGVVSMTRVLGIEEHRTLGLFVDRSERRGVEESLAFRYGLDRLITRLASRFVHTEPAQLTQSMERSIAEIGQFLDTDRCHLFLVDPADRSAVPAAHWDRTGAESDLSGFEHVNSELFPSFTKMLKESDAVIRLDPEVLSDTDMGPEATLMMGGGVQSGLIIPIHSEGEILGVLILCDVRQARRWSDEMVDLLPVLGEILGSAYSRHAAHGELASINAKLEERVALRTGDLLKANRELESFSYSVSHDLRSPLRSIDGFSQILLQEYATVLDDDGRELFINVRNASQRMGELIDALLELARANRTQRAWKPINMTALARNITATMRPSENLAVTVTEGLKAVGDQRLIELLLRKLITNAAKTSEFDPARPNSEVLVGVERQGKEHAFFVRTRGFGRDPRFTEGVLNLASSPASASEDSGGLLTMRRIAELHGGRIWARTDADQLTTVFFTLPGRDDLRVEDTGHTTTPDETA
jgi:signal transduction histidine kinase/PAS domain-containing protein